MHPPPNEIVVTGNVAMIDDPTPGANPDPNYRVLISLVNLEEDRISKNPEFAVKTDSGLVYKNPKIFMNLYVLFSTNKNDYEQALQYLSYVIQFFQYRNVFDSNNSPDLPLQIEKLIADLVTLNFEQLNHLWGVLGGKYIPSALYKVRLVTIDEGLTEAESELIREIFTEAKDFTH